MSQVHSACAKNPVERDNAEMEPEMQRTPQRHSPSLEQPNYLYYDATVKPRAGLNRLTVQQCRGEGSECDAFRTKRHQLRHRTAELVLVGTCYGQVQVKNQLNA
jgi:hypothetical protein